MSNEEAKAEWQARLRRYHALGGNPQIMALDRVAKIAFRDQCWDWDDNVPKAWAVELAAEWGVTE